VVFLPEAFDYISESKEKCLSFAHSVDGQIIQDLSQLAKDLDVWLSLGGFHEKVQYRRHRAFKNVPLCPSSLPSK
jgi:hypothetical protein